MPGRTFKQLAQDFMKTGLDMTDEEAAKGEEAEETPPRKKYAGKSPAPVADSFHGVIARSLDEEWPAHKQLPRSVKWSMGDVQGSKFEYGGMVGYILPVEGDGEDGWRWAVRGKAGKKDGKADDHNQAKFDALDAVAEILGLTEALSLDEVDWEKVKKVGGRVARGAAAGAGMAARGAGAAARGTAAAAGAVGRGAKAVKKGVHSQLPSYEPEEVTTAGVSDTLANVLLKATIPGRIAQGVYHVGKATGAFGLIPLAKLTAFLAKQGWKYGKEIAKASGEVGKSVEIAGGEKKTAPKATTRSKGDEKLAASFHDVIARSLVEADALNPKKAQALMVKLLKAAFKAVKTSAAPAEDSEEKAEAYHRSVYDALPQLNEEAVNPNERVAGETLAYTTFSTAVKNAENDDQLRAVVNKLGELVMQNSSELKGLLGPDAFAALAAHMKKGVKAVGAPKEPPLAKEKPAVGKSEERARRQKEKGLSTARARRRGKKASAKSFMSDLRQTLGLGASFFDLPYDMTEAEVEDQVFAKIKATFEKALQQAEQAEKKGDTPDVEELVKDAEATAKELEQAAKKVVAAKKLESFFLDEQDNANPGESSEAAKQTWKAKFVELIKGGIEAGMKPENVLRAAIATGSFFADTGGGMADVMGHDTYNATIDALAATIRGLGHQINKAAATIDTAVGIGVKEIAASAYQLSVMGLLLEGTVRGRVTVKKSGEGSSFQFDREDSADDVAVALGVLGLDLKPQKAQGPMGKTVWTLVVPKDKADTVTGALKQKGFNVA